MMRWFRQRWVWASLLGTTAALGLVYGQDGANPPSGPPQVGEVITLKFRDGPDRQFKVIKVDKQADGSYLSEVKDTKTGEIITLVDRSSEPAAKSTEPAKDPEPTKPKDAASPKDSTTPKDPATPKAKPKFLEQILPSKTPDKSATPKAGAATMPDQSQDPSKDPPKKPGLFTRIFGPKKPTPPAKPADNPATAAPPIAMPSTAAPAALPPVVLPTPSQFPPPGRTAEPAIPTPSPTPPSSGGTAEPPRVAPQQPIGPPVPMIPSPGSSSAPTIPVPSGPSSPLFPTPMSIPTPPASPATPAPMVPGLPSIPIPSPGGTASETPSITQARYVSAETAALMQEIEPYVEKLRDARAPSERIYALRSLAGCRHASSDTVKRVLFRSSVVDPCPLVRACCILELAKLGYFEPAFLAHLEQACSDPADDVQNAAKDALRLLKPQR